MKKLKFLEEFREKVYYCFKCGMCQYESYDGLLDDLPSLFSIVCPAWETWKLEAYTAPGKNEICRGLLENKISLDEKTLEIIYGCTLCGACNEQCSITKKTKHIEKFGGSTLPYDPLKIQLALRRQAVELGVGPLQKHKGFAESIRMNRNPYLESHETRFKWFKGSRRKNKAEIAYFSGCTASYRELPIAENTVKIFDKLGIDYTLLDEWCCGSPLIMTGQYEMAEDLAKHYMKEIKKAGVRTVVTSCAGCFRTLKEFYPEMIGETGFQVLHLTEFLNDLIQKGKLNFKKAVNATVTYHDPCHLGRAVGVYEAPRYLIDSINSANLIEIETRRNYSH